MGFKMPKKLELTAEDLTAQLAVSCYYILAIMYNCHSSNHIIYMFATL